MRSYRAHFSYYSEEWGNFDDMAYTVQAESPYEAREKAWQAWDEDEDTKFRSCVKLYAVTWNPNPLDAGDYFYSHAADIKQAVGHIEHVDIPNDRIEKHDRAEYYEREKHYYLGSLRTLDAVAQDLYAGRGMIPPSIYEELHYAEELCGLLENFNQAQALWDKISAAKKWDDRAYLFDIRDLLKNGYITLQGETVLFREHFGRTGIYPVYADLDDTDYKYINRWQRSWKVNSLANLRPLQPADVISHSASHMLYDYQLLLINDNHFPADYQKPENMIWTPSEDSMNITKDITEKFLVDNVITGERMLADRSDFWGVIRPDVVARYNFEALKSEYSAAHEMQNGITGAENGEIYPADYDEPGLEDGMEV